MSSGGFARPQGSIPGVRADRMGWQSGEEIDYYDDEGNKISPEEWKAKMRAKAKAKASEASGERQGEGQGEEQQE